MSGLITFASVVEIQVIYIIFSRLCNDSAWLRGTAVVEHDQVFVVKVINEQEVITAFRLYLTRILFEHSKIVFRNLILTHRKEFLA